MMDSIDLEFVSNSINKIKETLKDKSVNDDFEQVYIGLRHLKIQVQFATFAYPFIMSFIIDSLDILDRMIASYHKDRKCTMPELCDFCDHINNVIAMSLKII